MSGGIYQVKHATAIALVVMTVLAGCVAPKVPPASNPTDLIEDPLQISYGCPPGDTLTLSNGLCVTTFGDPRETLEEPYLAVHPQRPEVMTLGMNAWHADPRPVLRNGLPSLEIGRVVLFVTEDGGATWRGVPSPPILYGTDEVGKTSYSGDPVVEFDLHGVLHYLQTSVAFDGLDTGNFPYLDIQYARSEDIGASWSQNLLLADDGDNDRPWITVSAEGDLFATWRNDVVDDKPPQLAWSTDGGATWNTAAAPAECTHGDRAIVHASGVLVPCQLHEGGTATGIQINRFDRETGRFEALGRIATAEGWNPEFALVQWDQSRDGSVLAVATRQKDAGGFVTFSRDGGVTWSEPLALNDLCTCETETGSVHTYGAKFDAWGSFHIMLTDAYVGTPDNWNEGNTGYATGQRAVFHVVVDAYGNLLHEEKLTTTTQEDPRAPPSVGPPIGRDDYYVPAFWSDGGAIVWTRDKGIDLTHVVVGSSADASASTPRSVG